MRVSNWCLSWAYASVYAQHKLKFQIWKGPFKTFWAYVEGADVCTERAGQELMCALSVLIGTDAHTHVYLKLNDA